MMQPLDYIQYSKVYDVGSSILDKINLYKNPFYTLFYKGKLTIVKSNSKNLLFLNKLILVIFVMGRYSLQLFVFLFLCIKRLLLQPVLEYA